MGDRLAYPPDILVRGILFVVTPTFWYECSKFVYFVLRLSALASESASLTGPSNNKGIIITRNIWTIKSGQLAKRNDSINRYERNPSKQKYTRSAERHFKSAIKKSSDYISAIKSSDYIKAYTLKLLPTKHMHVRTYNYLHIGLCVGCVGRGLRISIGLRKHTHTHRGVR